MMISSHNLSMGCIPLNWAEGLKSTEGTHRSHKESLNIL